MNDAGIAQDSPANTYVGLTASLKGVTAKGEPGIYYPTGKRTYTRIVPLDTIQGAADLDALKGAGCKKLAIFDDTQAYGAGLAAVLKDTASMYGIQVVSIQDNAIGAARTTQSVAQQFASGGRAVRRGQRNDRQRWRHRTGLGCALRTAARDHPRSRRDVHLGLGDGHERALHRGHAGHEGVPGWQVVPTPSTRRRAASPARIRTRSTGMSPLVSSVIHALSQVKAGLSGARLRRAAVVKATAVLASQEPQLGARLVQHRLRR